MKQFNISTEIFYGENSLDLLNDIQNKNIFLVCDKFISSSPILENVLKRLDKCQITIFDEIIPDPPIHIVSKGIKSLELSNANTVIALGGGSVIDATKAINEFASQFNSNIKIEKCYAIPTTSGTGSELTEFSVITNLEEKRKYTLIKPSLLPDIAILDPSLVASVPPSITADTGMDVLTHSIEAYISKNATDFTDAFAEKAISLVFENLEEAFKNSTPLSREKMHNASAMAGIAFNHAGLGITHSLAHIIGAKLHIPHGRINAMILPTVIEYNSQINIDNGNNENTQVAIKLQKIAKSLGILSTTPYMSVISLIKAINNLNNTLGIPKTLVQYGVDLSEFDSYTDEIIQSVNDDACTKSNPVDFKKEHYLEMIKKIKG